MKSFKILLLFSFVLCSFAGSAQMQYLKSTSGKLIPYEKIKTVTTTNATPVIIDTIPVANNTAGIIEVTVCGSSAAGDGVTGKLIYRYSKAAGTLTVSSATAASAVTADTNVSGATFALAANSNNNAKLTITGKSGVTIKWRSVIAPYYNQ